MSRSELQQALDNHDPLAFEQVLGRLADETHGLREASKPCGNQGSPYGDRPVGVTDDMVEAFLAAVVGPDIVSQSDGAYMVRGDIRQGLEAVLCGRWTWGSEPPDAVRLAARVFALLVSR